MTPRLPDLLVGASIALLLVALFLRRAESSREVPDSGGLGIREAIESVQEELAAAEAAAIAENRATLFAVKDFDLELNVVVRESTSGQASGDFKLVTVGGATEYTAEKIQKITIRMVASAEHADSTGPTTEL